MTYKDSKRWLEAMHEEYKSLMHNNISVLVPKSKDVKIVGYIWLFKLKDCIDKLEPNKYKTSLITKGYTQDERVD